MKIKQAHPNVHFFVPLKNRQWFLDCGIHNVTELDWWQERELRLERSNDGADARNDSGAVVKPGDSPPTSASADATEGAGKQQRPKMERASRQSEIISANIGCLPCQHTSARGPFDRGHTLWASWSVESGGKKVWFGGWVLCFFFLSPPGIPSSFFASTFSPAVIGRLGAGIEVAIF
jgi:hypothetical protein